MPIREVHTQPAKALPLGSCDCHMHVFGPADQYPPSASRSYTPREAPFADYEAMASVVGLQRFVVIQPSAYGMDNRCVLDVMRAAGGDARGVVGFDPRMSGDALAELNRLGVRGVRLNFASVGTRDADAMAEAIHHAAANIAPVGWHIQLFTDLERLELVASTLMSLAVPVVVDHMGLARAALGVDQPGFDLLQQLLAQGNCWVKLSGAYRVSAMTSMFTDVAPIARALIAANPSRVIWGSDWPHTASHGVHMGAAPPVIEFRQMDAGYLLDLLGNWADDADVLEGILVRNPAALYRF